MAFFVTCLAVVVVLLTTRLLSRLLPFSSNSAGDATDDSSSSGHQQQQHLPKGDAAAGGGSGDDGNHLSILDRFVSFCIRRLLLAMLARRDDDNVNDSKNKVRVRCSLLQRELVVEHLAIDTGRLLAMRMFKNAANLDPYVALATFGDVIESLQINIRVVRFQMAKMQVNVHGIQLDAVLRDEVPAASEMRRRRENREVVRQAIAKKPWILEQVKAAVNDTIETFDDETVTPRKGGGEGGGGRRAGVADKQQFSSSSSWWKKFASRIRVHIHDTVMNVHTQPKPRQASAESTFFSVRVGHVSCVPIHDEHSIVRCGNVLDIARVDFAFGQGASSCIYHRLVRQWALRVVLAEGDASRASETQAAVSRALDEAFAESVTDASYISRWSAIPSSSSLSNAYPDLRKLRVIGMRARAFALDGGPQCNNCNAPLTATTTPSSSSSSTVVVDTLVLPFARAALRLRVQVTLNRRYRPLHRPRVRPRLWWRYAITAIITNTTALVSGDAHSGWRWWHQYLILRDDYDEDNNGDDDAMTMILRRIRRKEEQHKRDGYDTPIARRRRRRLDYFASLLSSSPRQQVIDENNLTLDECAQFYTWKMLEDRMTARCSPRGGEKKNVFASSTRSPALARAAFSSASAALHRALHDVPYNHHPPANGSNDDDDHRHRKRKQLQQRQTPSTTTRRTSILLYIPRMTVTRDALRLTAVKLQASLSDAESLILHGGSLHTGGINNNEKCASSSSSSKDDDDESKSWSAAGQVHLERLHVTLSADKACCNNNEDTNDLPLFAMPCTATMGTTEEDHACSGALRIPVLPDEGMMPRWRVKISGAEIQVPLHAIPRLWRCISWKNDAADRDEDASGTASAEFIARCTRARGLAAPTSTPRALSHVAVYATAPWRLRVHYPLAEGPVESTFVVTLTGISTKTREARPDHEEERRRELTDESDATWPRLVFQLATTEVCDLLADARHRLQRARDERSVAHDNAPLTQARRVGYIAGLGGAIQRTFRHGLFQRRSICDEDAELSRLEADVAALQHLSSMHHSVVSSRRLFSVRLSLCAEAHVERGPTKACTEPILQLPPTFAELSTLR